LLRQRLSIETLLPLGILVVFIPLLGNALYISMLLCPFVAVLGVLWLADLSKRARRKKLVTYLIALLCISSIVVPAWSILRWNSETQLTGDTVKVPDAMFNDANYLTAFYPDVPAISNVHVLPLQLAAMSDTDFLISGIPLVLSGDVGRRQIKDSVTFSDAPFPMNLYKWYVYQREPYADFYVLSLMMHGVSMVSFTGEFMSNSIDFFTPNSNLLVVVDNHWPNKYVYLYGILESKLLPELSSAAWGGSYPSGAPHSLPSYQSYQSERVTLYMVELPL